MIPAHVSALDEVAPPWRDLYVSAPEGGDGFLLDVEESCGFAIVNAASLKAKLAAARDSLRSVQARLDAYRGLPPAHEVERQLAKLDRLLAFDPLEEADRIARREASEVLGKMAKDHERAMAAADDVRERVLAALRRVRVAEMAGAAIRDAGGNPPLLLSFISDRLSMNPGTFEVFVTADDGAPTITIADLVDDLKACHELARAFGRA